MSGMTLHQAAREEVAKKLVANGWTGSEEDLATAAEEVLARLDKKVDAWTENQLRSSGTAPLGLLRACRMGEDELRRLALIGTANMALRRP